jgi:hypothetical protein
MAVVAKGTTVLYTTCRKEVFLFEFFGYIY